MYTIDYFIEKFEKIPEENWTIFRYEDKGKCCVFGHCGVRGGKQTPEGLAFLQITDCRIISINDGMDFYYTQGTPKQRVLAALRDQKSKELP